MRSPDLDPELAKGLLEALAQWDQSETVAFSHEYMKRGDEAALQAWDALGMSNPVIPGMLEDRYLSPSPDLVYLKTLPDETQNKAMFEGAADLLSDVFGFGRRLGVGAAVGVNRTALAEQLDFSHQPPIAHNVRVISIAMFSPLQSGDLGFDKGEPIVVTDQVRSFFASLLLTLLALLAIAGQLSNSMPRRQLLRN